MTGVLYKIQLETINIVALAKVFGQRQSINSYIRDGKIDMDALGEAPVRIGSMARIEDHASGRICVARLRSRGRSSTRACLRLPQHRR